jgi:hypothetical protein
MNVEVIERHGNMYNISMAPDGGPMRRPDIPRLARRLILAYHAIMLAPGVLWRLRPYVWRVYHMAADKGNRREGLAR